MIPDNLKEVTSICELHHYAKGLSGLLEEGLLVSDDVWVLYRC